MTDRLTAARLREVLSYSSETGLFTWLSPTSNRVRRGEVAGRKNGNGYIRISVDGRSYYAHRLAWLHEKGSFPPSELDHSDGNRSNNRLANLRPATHGQNGQNQPLRVTNTSGKHGVSWSRTRRKWAAYIWAMGAKKHLGLFSEKAAAAAAYLEAKSRMHQFQPVPRDINADLDNRLP